MFENIRHKPRQGKNAQWQLGFMYTDDLVLVKSLQTMLDIFLTTDIPTV